MPEVVVRRAIMSDLDELAFLFDGYRQFYEQNSDLAGGKAFLQERISRNESVILIAHVDGKPAGFTQIYPSFSSASMARIFVLNDLFVSPDARNGGVGRRLLEAAANHGRSVGAIRLTLSTGVINRPAQSLYESAGWKRDRKFCVYNLPLPRV